MNSIKSKLSVLALTIALSLNVNAQSINKGDITFDVFYGSPSIGTLIFKSLATASGEVDFNTFGPIGIKFEYMISDKVGLGVEGSYSTLSMKAVENGYTSEFTLNRIRIMPRFSYHMGSSDNFDSYFSLGMGYRNSTYEFSSTDVTATVDESITGGIPMAMRIAWGARYYFTPNIGLSTELGLGGGHLISGGLVIKI
ncbi:MAG: hypothetical protein ACJAZ2_000508 [Glaciecola sp.]|jgi:hypothetical protein